MTSTPSTTEQAPRRCTAAPPPTPPPRQRTRLIIAALAAALVIVAGGAVAITRALSGAPAAATGVTDNGYPTSLATVNAGSLSSETSVNGTLGDAGSNPVVAPSGTTQQALTQAEQQLASAEATLAADETAAGDSAASNSQSSRQSIAQAQQQVASAQAALAADETQASLSADQNSQTLSQDEAAVSAAQTKLSDDEAAVSAAQSKLASDQATDAAACDATPPAASCAADQQQVAQDQTALSQAQSQVAQDQTALTQAENALADAQLGVQQSQAQENAKVAADQAAVQNAETALSNAQAAAQNSAKQGKDQNDAKLTADRLAVQDAETAVSTARASGVNPGTTYTSVPGVGQNVKQGQALYAVDGIPVPLFYGPVTPWRDFQPGMTDGPDVAELNTNLQALGFGSGLTGTSHFSAATEAAVKKWQASIGAPQTGSIALGEVVFEPGEILVTAVTPSVGDAVQPGQTILTASTTTPQVSVDLDVSLQSDVKAGDKVTITLPDNSTTSGVVASVGTVATTPSGSGSGGGSGNGTPTITVLINLTDPSAAGHLSQAPVEVAITTATVQHALIVPVTALLAEAGGSYDVEVVGAHGVHHLVPVTLGLFDNASGAVQVTGSGLAAGDRVVVPGS